MVRFEGQPEVWLEEGLALSRLPQGQEEKVCSLAVRGTDFKPLIR